MERHWLQEVMIKQLKFYIYSLYHRTKIIKTIMIIYILLNPIYMILTTMKLNYPTNYVTKHYLTVYNNLVALILEFINAYFYPRKHRT